LKKIGLILGLVILFIIGGYSFYGHVGFLNVNKQLNNIVTSKTNIEKITADTETASFLKNLPKDTRCKHTSNLQGMNTNGEQYFVTTLDERKIQVFIKEDNQSNLYLKLFPNWVITSVEAE